jgi:hypothetical protein
MDWLSWGVALTEITTAASTDHNLFPLKRRRPPYIKRSPLPEPLVPTSNNKITSSTFSNKHHLLHISTALQFLQSLSNSPRLRLEANDDFIAALRTITNVLSQTLLSTSKTHSQQISRKHTTISLLSSLEETKQNITKSAMATEENLVTISFKHHSKIKKILLSIEEVEKNILKKTKSVNKKSEKKKKMFLKVNNAIIKINQWKNPADFISENNVSSQWDASVLEREILKMKQRIRKLHSKRIKLEREKLYYLPEKELVKAKKELVKVKELVEISKKAYKDTLTKSCKAQASATRRERKTAKLIEDSNKLRKEHQEWTRNNTPRPNIGEMLPEKILPKFHSNLPTNIPNYNSNAPSNVSPASPVRATIIERIAALESKFEKKLIQLSANVRRAYQQDDGDEESEENGGTKIVAHKTKSEHGKVYDDALGGMASWTLRMAFLRLRVALDGAVAKMQRNKLMRGFHRSEKLLKLGTTYVREEEVEDMDPQLETTHIPLEDTTQSKNAIQLSSNDIVTRMSYLVKTLKLMECADQSMKVRKDILQSAAKLNEKLREFDKVLTDRENDRQKKGSGMAKKRDAEKDHVDYVLKYLQLEKVNNDKGDTVNSTNSTLALSVYGLGNSDRVPLFLQTPSKKTTIKILQMNRHQVRLLLDAIWSERMGAVTAAGGLMNSRIFVDKMARKKNGDADSNISTFLQSFFQSQAIKKNTTPLVEAYSLWWSAQYICDDTRNESHLPGTSFIRMSRHVLAQVLPETVIPDSMKMLRSLRSFVVAISRREMGVPEPAEMVYKDNLIASLGRFFPTAGKPTGKKHHDLTNMITIIEKEYCNSSVVPVSWLFSVENVGDVSNMLALRADETSSLFVEAALNYYVDGSTRYNRNLLELLYSSNPAGDGKLTPSMCEYCLHHIMAKFHISRARVLKCISIGLGLMNQQIDSNQKMIDQKLANKITNKSDGLKKKKKKKTKATDGNPSSVWSKLKGKNVIKIPTGIYRLPIEWLNPLGAEQSTRRFPILPFWQNLVAHHIYRPPRFWFDGAEPCIRFDDSPDKPLNEMKCLKILLENNSNFNNGKKRKYLFADKNGKKLVVTEAAASCGYQLVRCRTPRRRFSAQKIQEMDDAYERKERKKRKKARKRGRRNSNMNDAGAAAQAAALFEGL